MSMQGPRPRRSVPPLQAFKCTQSYLMPNKCDNLGSINLDINTCTEFRGNAPKCNFVAVSLQYYASH